MKNVYELVKNEFVFGNEPEYYYHERAKRIAAAAAYIAQEVFVIVPLKMSALDFYNTALICQIADKSKPELYNLKRKKYFDDVIRGSYSICVAQFEYKIEMSEFQMDVIRRRECLETDILELAEAFVSLPTVEEISYEIYEVLFENPRINSALLHDKQVAKALRYLYQHEELNKTNWEMFVNTWE